jgi:hypothetical protein
MLSVNELSIETLHSIIKDLQQNNIQLRKEHTILKTKLEVMEKDMISREKSEVDFSESKMIEMWIDLMCEPADNVLAEDGKTLIAPTNIRILYDNFSEWSVENINLKVHHIPDLRTFKGQLMKWQQRSKYGLSYGKRKDQAGVNGYSSNMLFNLKLI